MASKIIQFGGNTANLCCEHLQAMWQLPSWPGGFTALCNVMKPSSFLKKLIVRQQLRFCEVCQCDHFCTAALAGAPCMLFVRFRTGETACPGVTRRTSVLCRLFCTVRAGTACSTSESSAAVCTIDEQQACEVPQRQSDGEPALQAAGPSSTATPTVALAILRPVE